MIPDWSRLGGGQRAHNHPVARVRPEARQGRQQHIGENGDEKRIIPRTRLSTKIGLRPGPFGSSLPLKREAQFRNYLKSPLSLEGEG